LGKNEIRLPKQKIAQIVTFSLGYFGFKKITKSFQKKPNRQKIPNLVTLTVPF
jgi:hypothetical protein